MYVYVVIIMTIDTIDSRLELAGILNTEYGAGWASGDQKYWSIYVFCISASATVAISALAALW